MNELQKILLTLLCEFDEICRKHNINYYLSGGTNLGALRHNGFIPWDDDADIRMPRKDYEKLEAVIDSEMPKGRELLSHSRFSNYISIIPRYVDMETTSIAKGRMLDGTPHGVFLDILILDPVPKDEWEFSEWKKNLYVYGELLETPLISASRHSDWDAIDIDRFYEYSKKADAIGKETVLAELEKTLFTIDEKDAEYYCMRFTSTWVGITPIEWYGRPREVLFEGKKLYIAEKAELCAYSNYGPEWKNIPDVTARTGHGTFKHVSLAAGNCEQEYMKLIDVKRALEDYKRYKDIRLNYFRIKFDVFMDSAQPYFRFINHKLNTFFNEHGIESVKMNTAEVLKVFSEYITLQLSMPYYRNSLYVPISDEYADILAFACYKENKVLKLQQLLSIREITVGLSNYQAKMKAFCDDILEVIKYIDIRQFDKAKEILKRNREHDMKQPSYVRSKMQLDLHFAKTEEERKELLRYAEEAVKNYPCDSEIRKYYGDVLEVCGQKSMAFSVYNEALNGLNNGLLIMDLSQKGICKADERMKQLCENIGAEDVNADYENENDGSEADDSKDTTND